MFSNGLPLSWNFLNHDFRKDLALSLLGYIYIAELFGRAKAFNNQ